MRRKVATDELAGQASRLPHRASRTRCLLRGRDALLAGVPPAPLRKQPRQCRLMALALLALAVVAISCVSAKREGSVESSPRPVWPPRPDAPRIRYVRSIASPADIGQGPSRWKRIVRFVTGDTG